MATIEIPLAGQHGIGRVALVDEEDYVLVSPWRWRAQLDTSGTVYARARIKGFLAMHRLILDAPLVDHINGNGLDNRRANLRAATKRQNKGNSRKTIGHQTSRFKGVHLLPSGKWRARIVSHGMTTHLGVFADEAAAARAFDGAARARYGEFAAVNFPLAGERSALREVSHA